jgi:hypothetical protein
VSHRWPNNREERALHGRLLLKLASSQKPHNQPNGWTYQNQYDLVLQEGRWYVPSRLTSNILRGPDEECFRNAVILVLDASRYTYVEGFAAPPAKRRLVHHAWVTDRRGQAIEPTWEDPGLAYCGIPFRTKYLREITLMSRGRNAKYGIITGRLHAEHNPFKNGFPGHAIAPVYVKVTFASLSHRDPCVGSDRDGGKACYPKAGDEAYLLRT